MRLFAAVFAVAVLACAGPVLAACPERSPCRGCGCKGGPGYRGPDGRCVGFRELAKVCGPQPERRCTFENAPGHGRQSRLCPRQADEEPGRQLKI